MVVSYIRDAVCDLLTRNALAYLIVQLIIVMVYRVGDYCLTEFSATTPLYAATTGFHIALVLILTSLMSAAQSILFSRLGADIARPIWRYRGWLDSVKRFFLPWIIINLALVTTVDLGDVFFLNSATELTIIIACVFLLLQIASIPFGSAVMFWGKLRWTEIPAALKPYVRFFRLSLVLIGLAFLQYLFMEICSQIAAMDSVWMFALRTTTDIPLILTDVVLFSLSWRVCLLNQTTPEEMGNPFDF